MGRVPSQYSAQYQNIHLVTNQVRLQKDDDCVEGQEWWMGAPGPERWAAAAAKLSIDPISPEENYRTLWDMVTRFC
jgi:hypothetical protein